MNELKLLTLSMTFNINSNDHIQINSNKNQTKVIRGRETTCDGELKNTTSKHINPNRVIKKHSDSST